MSIAGRASLPASRIPRIWTNGSAGASPSQDAGLELISIPRRLRWIALAAVPSSLLLGTTTLITTDIAAVPLL